MLKTVIYLFKLLHRKIEYSLKRRKDLLQSSEFYHSSLKECSESRDDRNYINRCECSGVNSEDTGRLIVHALPFAVPTQQQQKEPHHKAMEWILSIASIK